MLIMQILLLLQQLRTHEKFVKAIVFVIIIFDLQCKLTTYPTRDLSVLKIYNTDPGKIIFTVTLKHFWIIASW